MTVEEKYDLSLYRPVETRKESKRVMVELVRCTLDDQLYVKKTYGDTSLRSVFETVKSLLHPGIVGIEVVAEDAGSLIVIEQYLPGLTLEHCAPPDRKSAVAWALQLCAALEYLHMQGILHRDLKPSNIMCYDGRLTLFDFDIARTLKDDKEKDTEQIGTRGYAPPEQFGFSQTDERSDVYSLGVILNSWVQGTNDPLARIAKKCTAFDPGNRYQTVKTLSADLRRLRQTQSRRLSVWAILLAVVLIPVLWYLLSHPYISGMEPPATETSDPAETPPLDIHMGMPDSIAPSASPPVRETPSEPAFAPTPAREPPSTPSDDQLFSPSASPMHAPSPSPMTSPSPTPAPDPSPTHTPSPVASPPPSPVPSPSPTPSPPPSPTPSPTPTPSPSPVSATTSTPMPAYINDSRPEESPPPGWNRYEEGDNGNGPYERWYYPDGSTYRMVQQGINGDGTCQIYCEYPNGDYYIKLTAPNTGGFILEAWEYFLPDGIKYTYGINADLIPFEQWTYADGSQYWVRVDLLGNKQEHWSDANGNTIQQMYTPHD